MKVLGLVAAAVFGFLVAACESAKEPPTYNEPNAGDNSPEALLIPPSRPGEMWA